MEDHNANTNDADVKKGYTLYAAKRIVIGIAIAAAAVVAIHWGFGYAAKMVEKKNAHEQAESEMLAPVSSAGDIDPHGVHADPDAVGVNIETPEDQPAVHPAEDQDASHPAAGDSIHKDSVPVPHMPTEHVPEQPVKTPAQHISPIVPQRAPEVKTSAPAPHYTAAVEHAILSASRHSGNKLEK